MKFINAVLPSRCPLSGEIVAAPGTLSPAAWSSLAFISAPFCDICGVPFAFAPPKGAEEEGDGRGSLICAPCLAARPSYARARAALIYNDASREMILRFKHGDQLHLVVAMLPWLRQAGADLWGEADVILPVPLHRWRLFRRRYNQAAVMAKAVARDAGLKYLPGSLARIRATPPQGYLKAAERRANVQSAFCVPPRRAETIKGKRVILIDDVYTTGSTVSECTKTLLDAGAAEVSVLCLARVVKGL
ncbi:MAG: ComF family protein [Micavibrio sp.]